MPTAPPEGEYVNASDAAASTDPRDQQRPSRTRDGRSSHFWAEVDGLQPSSLLNREAARGRFSMQNILSVSSEQDIDSAQSNSSISEDDPILQGLVSYHVAASLFEGQVTIPNYELEGR